MHVSSQAVVRVAAEDSPLPPALSASQPASRGRVLLVEDHVDTLRIMARLLGSVGYTVSAVSSARAALHLMTTHAFDVVVSDIGLSDSDGHQLMRDIRERGPTPGIALSGYGMAEDVKKSKDAGFAEHLVKPVEFEQLDHAIATAIVRRTIS